MENKESKTIYNAGKDLRGGFISEFLWICSGADREVLRQCPSDYAKYAGIGGTILFTALMAMLSGGYAIATVFDDYDGGISHIVAAVFFGIFWGLLIFNLDRFMVNTMYSDGTAKITKEEIMSGLPRIILAIFLGIVISTPIELRIFKDKIDAQIELDKADAAASVDKKHSSIHKAIRALEGRKRQNNAEKDAAQRRLTDAQERLYGETAGKVGSGVAGDGPAAKRLKELVAIEQRNCKDKEEEVRRENESIDKQLEKLYADRDSIAETRDAAVNSMQGFTARLKALNNITSEDSAMHLVRLLVTLLFVAIEIIPTIFKMMMESGPYDDLIRAEQHRIRVLADKRISDINDEVNTDVQISVAQNEKRLETQLAANTEVLTALANAQAEVIKEAIRLWQENELKKVKENPELYLSKEESTMLNTQIQTQENQSEEEEESKA